MCFLRFDFEVDYLIYCSVWNTIYSFCLCDHRHKKQLVLMLWVHLDRSPQNCFTVSIPQQNIDEKPYATTSRVKANFFPIVLRSLFVIRENLLAFLKRMTIFLFFFKEKLACNCTILHYSNANSSESPLAI